MEKWFYTDLEANQQGPVDEEALLRKNADGTINANSLVWKEGMEGWVLFRDVAAPLLSESDEGVPAKIGVCAYSSRVYLMDDMIPYGEALIGLDHKEAFIQQLMETGTVEVADATEKRFEYGGFWWRCLSSFLDYLVKMIPYGLCMVPYYIVMFSMGMSESDFEQGDDFPIGLAVAMGVGMLGIMGVSIFYETWMVGKYQGTLGKLIVGLKVVNPDGSRLSYKKAFFRWVIKKPVNSLIVILPMQLAMVLAIFALGGGMSEGGGGGATVVLGTVTAVFVSLAIAGLCSGVYWMAAFDREKRALQDRICATRVIKK